MSTETVKTPKKKSLVRKIIKGTAIGLVVLIAIIIAIPFMFKDELKEMVLAEVNKTLKADVALGDIDLTLLSTFPNLTLVLTDVSVTGRTSFKGVELAKIGTFEAQIGLWDVIGGDKIEIDAIRISDAAFDVRVSPEGDANYDIVIPVEEQPKEVRDEPSNFQLSLQEYAFENIQLVYDDQASDLYTKIKNLNHEGTGDLTADVIDFETITSMDALTFEMEGLTYLSEVKTAIDMNLLMEFVGKSSKFTLKENSFALNNLKLGLDGFYAMNDGYDDMDLKLNAETITFKDLLSLVPTFYKSGYESMIAKGTVALKGVVKGRMDDKALPGWDFGLNVNNASIKYPDVPGTISNIQVVANSAFAGGENLDKMTIDVPKLHADFVGNVIDAKLKMRNPMTDPLIDAALLAKVNLATLGKVMPLAEGESYAGKLDADMTMKGRMSSLEKEDYEAFNATGTLKLAGMEYASKDLPDMVKISNMLFRFTPQNLSLEALNATMGKSDFAMVGKIDNYMGYVFRDELLKGDFTFTSNYLDLDQLMGTSAAPAEGTPAKETPAATASEPFLIPNNVDFNLNTKIGKVRYNGIDISDINGGVKLKEEVATLDNLTMNALGGGIGLNGSYSTKDHNKPMIDFGYKLADIDIAQLTKNFLTIEKLAPIAKYTTGKISSSFTMNSALTPGLEPIYSSLNGNGDLFTKVITISGFEPLKKLSEELKISKLASQTIKDFKAKFKFADGKLNVTPFKVMLSGIETEVGGSTSFTQDIDYKMNMRIPKEMIPASAVKLAEQGLAKVNGMVPKLNVGSFPDNINVQALVGGTVMKPVIKTDMKDALLKATGNFKENVKEKGKELINKAKDSVKTIVTNKVNEVKEDLNAKKQEIIEDAQKQADKVKAEAVKAANQIRAEGDKQAESLVNEAGGNPLKKKAAEIAGKKVKKEAEEKAQKVEKEGQERADGIMSKAREKADQIK